MSLHSPLHTVGIKKKAGQRKNTLTCYFFHGASDRNRTCNPLITNQLRYRCATLAHLALSREAC